MNFFKIKHIGLRIDGTIVCHLTTGEAVVKTRNGYYMGNDIMTPLFDIKTGELVGFFNPHEITIESIEFED